MPRQPNIILCMCDQLRAFEVGCYGNPVIRTPHIDGLASEGHRFETAVSNYPVCMPARSILLSGQHNRRCTGGMSNVAFRGRPGSFDMPEYPDHGRPHLQDPTLPEALRGLGYYTAAIGKWHIHSWPHDIGFDHYLIPRVHHCHTAQSFTENGGPEFAAPGYSVDFEAERVAHFLQEQSRGERPFFLYYNISPPHCPLRDAPEKYLTMYDPEDIPIRPNVDLNTPLQNQDYHFKVYRWDFRYYSLHLPYTEDLPEDYDLRHLIADYYGLTTWVDDTVGRMLTALDANGLADDTIVVFTSDHGDNLGSQGLVQKGGPNEESIRVPLVLRWPALGRQACIHEQQVASLIDLAPTLIDLAGGPVPHHMHGRTLAPLLHGERRALEDDGAYIETGGGVALRTPMHSCFVPWKEKGTLADRPQSLYDLRQDPYQLRNLIETGEEAEVAGELDARLRAWDARTPWMEG